MSTCGSKSQTSVAHLALASNIIAIWLKSLIWNWPVKHLMSYPAVEQSSKRLRWGEWKSVMLSPYSQLVGGGGRREGRLERRLLREKDATAAETEPLPPEAEWKIVMPVAGGWTRGTQQRLGDAVDAFVAGKRWQANCLSMITKIWMVCPKLWMISERDDLAWHWQCCIWNESISPHMDSSWK